MVEISAMLSPFRSSSQFEAILKDLTTTPLFPAFLETSVKSALVYRLFLFGAAMIIASFVLFMKLDRYVWMTVHKITDNLNSSFNTSFKVIKGSVISSLNFQRDLKA